MMIRLYHLYFLLSLTLIFSYPVVSSPTKEVQSIEVSGSHRLNIESIKSLLPIKKGDNITEEKIHGALTEMYSSKFFSHVDINYDRGILYLKIVEVPVIADISVEGERGISKGDIKAEVHSSLRSPFQKSLASQDVRRLLSLYNRHGYNKTSIEYSTVDLDENRISLSFKINEGYKTKIKEIEIKGSKAFSSRELKRQLLSKKQKWWRFLSKRDVYDKERMEQELLMLKSFYGFEGYLDFKVVSNRGVYTEEGKYYSWFIEIEEGDRSKLRHITIENPYKDLDSRKIRELVKLNQGEILKLSKVQSSQRAISDYISESGYSSSLVTFDFNRVESEIDSSPSYDLVYKIMKTPRIYVREFNINGNNKTLDTVILREINVKEGDILNMSLLGRGEQQVQKLGYFSSATVRPISIVGDGSRKDIEIRVAEKQTGSINGGVGWSTLSGFTIDLGISNSNYKGTGNNVSIDVEVGSRIKSGSVSIFDPYFFGEKASGGFVLSYRESNYTSLEGLNYEEDQVSLTLSSGWEYFNNLTNTWRLTALRDNYVNEELGYNFDNGITDLQLVSQNLIYDLTTYHLDARTRDGLLLSWGAGYAGFFGTENYLKNDFSAGLYFAFFNNAIQFKSVAKYGTIQEINNKPLKQQYGYILGGDSFRGFDFGGVSPKLNLNTSASYRSEWMLSGTNEFSFPLGLPKMYEVKGLLFSDYGVTGDATDNVKKGVEDLQNGAYPDAVILYSNKIRVSAGVGITWNSPMGPLALSWAIPIVEEPWDQKRLFWLTFRSTF
ncbi:MAG: outer membrane protein assembly factor BamA [Alphaproteobacteria bacterium]|nr:outer membrane protein assembly factor BamA [Alphaproteobacteria bacterium]